MPSKPPRICTRCRKTTPVGQRCPCTPAWEGSAWTGGSDRRWRTIRARQLAQHPVCQWPGCHRLAVHADHIVNLAAGGRKYDPTNVQSLCEPHHQEKTQAEAATPRGVGGPREAP